MKVASISALDPLPADLPRSASDYYAIAKAGLDRISADIHCIENAMLTIDYSQKFQIKFSVADSKGNWLPEINRQEEIKPRSSVHRVEERVGFLEDRFSGFNVCHFLFDKLGRTTELGDIPIDSYFMFLDHSYYSEVFSLLGIKQTDLVSSSEKIVTYRIDNLYISTSTFRFRHPGFNFSPDVMKMLKRLKATCIVDDTTLDLGKRIYIDRTNISARDVLNKDVLYSLLNEFDFVPVVFEEYSLSEQAQIVHQADILLGVHGAGLSNAMFYSNDNFKLLEILPPMCATNDYWKLASAFGIGYDAYIANDKEYSRPDYSVWEHDATYNRRDILLDENEFRKFLEINI